MKQTAKGQAYKLMPLVTVRLERSTSSTGNESRQSSYASILHTNYDAIKLESNRTIVETKAFPRDLESSNTRHENQIPQFPTFSFHFNYEECIRCLKRKRKSENVDFYWDIDYRDTFVVASVSGRILI